MEKIMEKIDLKNIDKSNWKTFRFDQIAKKISETVDPNTTQLTTYVGLEHLDAESIHIKRFGTPADVSGAKLKCYPGDVIFGKRRAYQRKASIVNFEGICSAHAFVLRAIPEVIDPALFPFFLHSDVFMHCAVDISVGGLSPTINWGQLKEQEFLLPPKDQQKQLAELLWAMDEVIEKEKEVLDRLEDTYQTSVDNLFSKKQQGWDYKPVSRIGKINAESLKGKTSPDYEFYYLDIAGIVEPKIVGNLKKLKFSKAPSRARRIVKDASIVLSMVRPYQQSFVYIEKANDLIASTGTGVINFSSEINSKFIFHQFFSKKFIRYCEDRMTGTNYPAITPLDIEQYKVGIPKDKVLMDNETIKLEELDNSKLLIKSKIASSKSLQKSLINQIF